MLQAAMTEGLQALLLRLLDARQTPLNALDRDVRWGLPILAANHLVRISGGCAVLTIEGRDVAECYASARRVH